MYELVRNKPKLRPRAFIINNKSLCHDLGDGSPRKPATFLFV